MKIKPHKKGMQEVNIILSWILSQFMEKLMLKCWLLEKKMLITKVSTISRMFGL